MAALTLLVLYYFWNDLQDPIRKSEFIFKIIGFVIGPLFAIIGFFTTRIDKIEIQ